jgi:hypothetical protein
LPGPIIIIIRTFYICVKIALLLLDLLNGRCLFHAHLPANLLPLVRLLQHVDEVNYSAKARQDEADLSEQDVQVFYVFLAECLALRVALQLIVVVTSQLVELHDDVPGLLHSEHLVDAIVEELVDELAQVLHDDGVVADLGDVLEVEDLVPNLQQLHIRLFYLLHGLNKIHG